MYPARPLALLAALIAITGSAQQKTQVTVQLLAINDLHANLEAATGPNGMVNDIPAGGVEYLATHLKNAIRDNPDSLVVGAGDLMGASPLISGLFHDAPTIEALNAMNLSVTSIGNHELDHGPDDLIRRIRGGCLQPEGCREGETSPPARYSYLAANVVRSANRAETLLPGTAIRTVAGVKIGFIGETLQGTPQIVSAASVRGLEFLEESAVANRAAAQLEREGVHAIVLLIHEGGAQRPASGPPDPNGCANLTGGIGAVVNRLSPLIKVVITGHSHQFYNCEMGGHLVTSAGSFGRLVTRINLTIDPATDVITAVSAKNEIVTRDVPKDPAQTAILEKYRPRVTSVADRPAGSITREILKTPDEAGESAIGDVLADAHLASVASADKGGAVIAFMNPGGIRAPLMGKPRPDGTREVSYNDLFTVQPFGNRITVVTMTGDMVRRLLEQQFRPEGRRSMLEVSNGFTYRYKLNAPAGEHVVPGSIMLNGKPILPADKVRVEAIDFMITGGGGYTVFAEGTDNTPGPLDIDAVVDYFATHSPVAPGPRNRIVRVD